MKLPSNWNSIESREYGEFKAIEPGGYICRVVKAQEKYSMSNKHMLVIYFDIDEGDFKGFYKQHYDAKVSKDKKWSGAYYQLTEGNSESYFKGMITAIENSNPGFTFTGNASELENKIFGGIFGEEEYQKQDGSIGSITKIFYIASIDRIRNNNFSIPKKKELKIRNQHVMDISDDDLPF